MKNIVIKLVRILKFRSHGPIPESLNGEVIKKSIVWCQSYPGCDSNTRQDSFTNRAVIDLAQIFKISNNFI